ncbi:MAG: DMT family transporter [Firmicutes bacterium]|nr:DMT family transporter [Bacillota bacterium]
MRTFAGSRYFPYLLLIAGTFFWSTNFVLGRFLAGKIPPFTFCAGRFTVSALIFAGMAAWYRWELPRGRQWAHLTAMALTGIFLFNSILYLALSHTTALNATLVNSLNPLLTVLMAMLFLGERPGVRLWLGLLASVAGVFYIAAGGEAGLLLGFHFNRGDLFVLLGALIWGLYSIAVRVATRELPVLLATAYANWIGVLFLYPVVYKEIQERPVEFSAATLGVFVYLGIFASVVAFICWNWSVRMIGPVKATVFYNLIPLYAAVLSPLFLDEKLHLYHLAGGLLIVGGVLAGTGTGFREAKPRRD